MTQLLPQTGKYLLQEHMGIAMLVSNLTLSTEEFCVLIYIDLLFFKFCFSCATFIFSSSIYKILSTNYNEALL